ncbi:MAG: zf-HC2 domain-containing protein, partial [Acidobacteriota bacterium]
MKICKAMDETRLSEYVDGELAAAARNEIERHLRGCADCPGIVDEMRAIRSAAAGLPREIEPPRDLWSGIASRIEGSGAAAPADPDEITPVGSGEVTPVGSGEVTPVGSGRFHVARSWNVGLAAAAAVVILVAGAAFLMRDDRRLADGEATPPPGASVTLASLKAAGAGYRRMTAELETLIEARRGDLSPATLS